MKHYKGYSGSDEQENIALYEEFERLKSNDMKRKIDEKLTIADICEFQTSFIQLIIYDSRTTLTWTENLVILWDPKYI